MAVNVDRIEALEILKETYDNAERISNEIGDKISLILEGSHKTYKYILITGLLAKATNSSVDIFSLQAKDETEGAYDARSLCHKVLVPFEREYFPNSLGGSNEPYLNKPARFTRLTSENAVRKGYDRQILGYVLDVFEEISNSETAILYLIHSMSILKDIYENLEERFVFEKAKLSENANSQYIYLIVLMD